MISLEEALSRMLAAVQPLSACSVPLSDAAGRFASADLASRIDLPLFDNSAMDGYAVHSEVLKNAAAGSPVRLACEVRVAAGDTPSSTLLPGACARVFTGSPIPSGADAVVMQEDVQTDDNDVLFIEPVKPLENVRLRGEDIRAGATLLKAGDEITPTRIALLGAAGCAEVPVRQRSRVAVVATGNELREPGASLRPGEIYESNGSMLAAFLKELRADTAQRPLVSDTLDGTISALREAFERSDLVITSGGVSVGEFDFVKEAFSRLGGVVDLWKIAMRPGKPFVFGRYGRKFLFGLPGNPVSALVTFLLLVRPAILKMHGAGRFALPHIPGELASPVVNRADRRHFIRIRWQKGIIHPAGPQKSHMIGALGEANGLLDLAPGVSLSAGATAHALLWQLPTA